MNKRHIDIVDEKDVVSLKGRSPNRELVILEDGRKQLYMEKPDLASAGLSYKNTYWEFVSSRVN